MRNEASRLLTWILAALVGAALGLLPALGYRFGTHAKT